MSLQGPFDSVVPIIIRPSPPRGLFRALLAAAAAATIAQLAIHVGKTYVAPKLGAYVQAQGWHLGPSMDAVPRPVGGGRSRAEAKSERRAPQAPNANPHDVGSPSTTVAHLFTAERMSEILRK